SSAGDIFISEADDVQVNTVNAAAGGSIAISAAGAISDDANDTTRITGTNVALSAARIGASDNRVDTAAGSLSATTTSGGIYVSEQDDITLVDVRTSGAANAVDLRTGGNGNITAETLITQGGAVNLAAGGTGSLNVTGAIESNNGVVNLTAGDT